MSIRAEWLPVVVAAGWWVALTASGQDTDDIDRTPVRYVSMRQIQSTRVVDDIRILFYRSGGRICVNALDNDCPTLKRNGLFNYRVNSGSLSARVCDSDAISVIDRLTNSVTYTCGLSMPLKVASGI